LWGDRNGVNFSIIDKYCLYIIYSVNPMDSLLSRITQIPGQCGGRPCIRGMRIRVSDILEMLAENVKASEILEEFPDLEIADIQACLVFAARRTDFSRLTA
jgi:uncharacterized protein (DUF433 family)